MSKEQRRNEKCRCNKGLKFKNCCGRNTNQSNYESDKKKGESNDEDGEFIKMILDYWDSDNFREAVLAIEHRPIDEMQMAEKKEQLLNMSERVKDEVEMHFMLLSTGLHIPTARHIPIHYYNDPTLIISYELYGDPVSIELRTFGSPFEIEQAIRAKIRKS